MKGKIVQAVIIKDNKILLAQSECCESPINRYFFIRGDINENENEYEAIKRELKSQLNLRSDIAFKFSKELNEDITTFLIDLSGKQEELSYDVSNIKCFNEGLTAAVLKWVNLSGKNYFYNFEMQYIRLLAEECIKNQYRASWVSIIENTYFDNSLSKYNKKYLHKKHMEIDRNSIDSKTNVNDKLKVMIMALVIGILFNHFFIWDSIGISGFIFNAVIIGFAMWTAYPNINLNKRIRWLFLIPTILLSASYFIYNNEILRALNGILIPLLIVSYILTIRYEDIKDIKINLLQQVFDRIFPVPFGVIPKFYDFTKEMIRSNKTAKNNSTKKNIFMGLLISLPLLIIIVGLLTSADMIFKYYIENIGKIFNNFDLGSIIGHTLVVVFVTLYSFGFLWSLKYKDKKYPDKYFKSISSTWEPVTIITMIFVISTAYLLFSIIQFSYLYGGGKHVLPNGFSYSEYARKGFFELVAVTIINFIILLLSMKFTKKENKKINKVANIVYSLLIIFTLNMLFSANYKMNMYENALGFTRLRIFVQIFMFLLFVLLLIVLIGIWKKNVPILKLSLIAIMVIYVGLNFMNVDRVIAKKNIRIYYETKIIDVEYLKSLSYDAVPEIEELLYVDDSLISEDIHRYIKREKSRLNRCYDNWYEFNFYKRKVLKLEE